MLQKKEIKLKDFDNSNFTFDLDIDNDHNLFIISESAQNESRYCTTEMYEKIGNYIKNKYKLNTFIYIEKYKNDNYLRIKNFETDEKSTIQTEFLTSKDIKNLTS